MARRPGHTYGTAGGSLEHQSFTTHDRARVGQKGEQKTALLLAEVAARGATVIHDLRIPIPGFAANIDHAVISGDHVTLIDSKVWKPGRYWTLAGRTRRGAELVPHADKKTLPTAAAAVARHLAQAGAPAQVNEGLLLVWPSSGDGRLRFGLYRPSGARALDASASRSARSVARHTGTATANPRIVAALSRLIIS